MASERNFSLQQFSDVSKQYFNSTRTTTEKDMKRSNSNGVQRFKCTDLVAPGWRPIRKANKSYSLSELHKIFAKQRAPACHSGLDECRYIIPNNRNHVKQHLPIPGLKHTMCMSQQSRVAW